MKVTGIKTDKIRVGDNWTLKSFAEKFITDLPENSVVVFSSKVIGLIEGRAIPTNEITRDELAKREADFYLSRDYSKYNHMFTINHRTLIACSGIDESNADGHFALWPHDPMKSAAALRDILAARFKLKNIGVIISDSTVMPLRRGSLGIMIAWSGFMAVEDLRGEQDLFGRPLHITTRAMGSGLAAAGNVVMGENAEQMPIAVITDIPFVKFYNRSHITPAEYEMAFIGLESDLFAPFLSAVEWKKGGKH